MKAVPLNPHLWDLDVEEVPTRNGYGEALVTLGDTDERVVVLTADLSESTRVEEFGKRWPERFVQCGVAEQNMMGIAAGLAAAGKIPFVSSYAVFSPGRNWDQTRVSVAYSRLPVKIAGAHTGLSVGPDGATHQALEDIALMRVLPNMTVVVPCDAIETRKATLALATTPTPAYIRFTREKTPIITREDTPFKVGKAEVLFDGGHDVVLVACGPLVYEALKAAKELETKSVGVMVVNCHTVKPLDEATLLSAAKKCQAVVTVEEHQVMAGMGSAVIELLATHYPVPVEQVGMPDTFGESGAPAELIQKYGMDASTIKDAIVRVLRRKRYDR